VALHRQPVPLLFFFEEPPAKEDEMDVVREQRSKQLRLKKKKLKGKGKEL
jgi:hypothetical protein